MIGAEAMDGLSMTAALTIVALTIAQMIDADFSVVGVGAKDRIGVNVTGAAIATALTAGVMATGAVTAGARAVGAMD